MRYTYLFECNDNYGNESYKQYFSSDKELNQDVVNECILHNNKNCFRLGSTFSNFYDGAKKKGIKVEQLGEQTRVDGVFDNITGNY